jgi:hypothetical protein
MQGEIDAAYSTPLTMAEGRAELTKRETTEKLINRNAFLTFTTPETLPLRIARFGCLRRAILLLKPHSQFGK